jgi:hypothetical protein
MGIYGVTLNTINTTTNGTVDGSPDYSCTTSTTLAPGAAYTIRVVTNADENVRVWLDYDNNGSFNPATELFFSSSNARVHTGTTGYYSVVGRHRLALAPAHCRQCQRGPRAPRPCIRKPRITIAIITALPR